MKTYKTFISELFDRKIPMKPSSTGDTTWGYTFVLMNKGGKAELAPQGKDLEAFVIGWFLKNKSTDIVPTLGSLVGCNLGWPFLNTCPQVITG